MNENNPLRGGDEADPYFDSNDQEEAHENEAAPIGEERRVQQEPIDPLHDRRTIRDIPLGNQTQKRNMERQKMRERYVGERRRKQGRGGLYILIAVLIVVFLFFLFIGASLFAQATITLVPRSETVELNETLTLSQDNAGNQALAYDIITVDLTRAEVLEAMGEEEVSRSATGRITVYNTYSEEDQPIVARTRFEAEDGRIYRSPDAFVVPGMSDSGEPGSVTITVVADEPGESYNLEGGSFTVPGLEGTDLFEGFHAEVETPIVGGFVGVQKTVDESSEEEAREALRETLESDLRTAVLDQIGEDAVLFEDTLFIEYEDLPPTENEGGVEVPVRGTLYAVVFAGDDLARFVAEETLDDYDNMPVSIGNPESIELVLREDTELTLDALEDDLAFTISGSPILVWDIRTEALIEDVVGDSKTRALEQIGSFPGVASGKLEVRPGFVRSLPSDIEKVGVVVNEPLAGE